MNIKNSSLFVSFILMEAELERPVISLIKGKPAFMYVVGEINLNGGKTSKAYVFKINSKNWNK